MRAEIGHFKKLYFNRIIQLANKTNQFNLTNLRITEKEIESLIGNKLKVGLYARLSDKFGDNGLVSIILGSIIKDELHIDLWCMSCRVFNRTLENSLLNKLVEESQKKGVKKIIGTFIPTDRNQIVSNLFSDLGFSLVSEVSGVKTFHLDIKNYIIPENKNILIVITNES